MISVRYKNNPLFHVNIWTLTDLALPVRHCGQRSVYFQRWGGVAHSSVRDYLLFTRQCWINTDDPPCVFAYKSMCGYRFPD